MDLEGCPKDMRKKITWLAEQRGLTEEEIIMFALEEYLDDAIITHGECISIMNNGDEHD